MTRSSSNAIRVAFVFLAALAICFSQSAFAASARFAEKDLGSAVSGLKPLSLAHGDFNSDGVQDVVAGYGSFSGGALVFYKGNRDANHPFLAARTVMIPVKPNFLGAGDFDADGKADVVLAVKGGSTLYFISGDGHGGMGTPRAVNVDGRISALVTGEMNRRDGLDDVVVAVSGSKGAQALVFEHPNGAMRATPEAIALPGKATSLTLGRFGGKFNDLSATVGAESIIVRGRDRSLSLDKEVQAKVAAPVLMRTAAPTVVKTPGVVASLAMRLNKDGVQDQVQLTSSGQLKIQLSLPNFIYVVNDVGDGPDFAFDGVCEVTSGGGDCSLRAAIEEVNNGAGNDEIDFNIPGVSNVSPAVIAPGPALPPITQSATIDASTQDAFIPGSFVILDGSVGCPVCDGLTNSVNDTVLIGMLVQGFENTNVVANNAMTIRDCWINAAANHGVFALGPLTVESTGALAPIFPFTIVGGNLGSGIVLALGSDGSTIQGSFIGDVNGNGNVNVVSGIFVNSDNNLIGGTTAGAGNTISGNGGPGIDIGSASANVVQGNFIGTDSAGTSSLANGFGVFIEGGSGNNIIGGTTAAARNVISGNTSDGVSILDDSFQNKVQGNFIGTDISGSSALGNGFRGIFIGGINSTTENAIGGTASGAGNIIAFNTNEGILIDGTGGINTNQNAIRHNSIFSNGDDGIRLFANGNDDQAEPNLVDANSGGGTTTIDGLLTSTASTSYVLEFFSSPTCDPSGFGEGQTFIGSKLVTTDGAGNAVYAASLPVTVAPGQNITATATDLTSNINDTSEFSNCVAIPGVACPTITVAPASMPNGTVGTTYPTQVVTGSGGTAPYTFSITSGALPTGLTLDPNTGQISGTPTAGGTFNFTVTATDATACTGSRAYSVTMTCPVITLTSPPLPGGTVGTFYNTDIIASGGTGTITYTVSAGAIPPGTTLSTGGNLSGTPTTAGTFNFTVLATDQNGCTGSQAYSITVACPVITLTPATLPDGVDGTPYNQNVSASGGTGPYSYAVTFGAPPNGLTFNASGNLSGTPTTPASFTFTITATDFYGCQGSQSYQINIACPTITLTPGTLPNGQIGIGYSQFVSVLSGGTAPFTFTVSSGTPPTGLTLSAAGQLSGTPTAPGLFSFTVQATDVNGCVGSQAYSITITSPLLLFDDFGDDVMDWIVSKGIVTESGGELHMNGPKGQAEPPLPWTPSGQSLCILCTVEVDLLMNNTGSIRTKVFIDGWVNKTGRVELTMAEHSNKWILKQIDNGVVVAAKKFVNVGFPIDFGTPYNIKITFDGVNFTVKVNDSTIMVMPKGATPAGKVYLKLKNTNLDVDTIQVYQ